MRSYVITTDSNSDLPIEYIKENQIGIIPHYYDIDGVTYGDEINLTPEEFYQRMRDGIMPTTMASNPVVIHNTFTNYVEQGMDVLHISFSSALSGGCSNICVGAAEVCEEHPEATIHVIDSLNVSMGQGMMIMKAVELKNAGVSLEEATKYLEEHKMDFCVQFTVDDLFHLQRGGRVSKTTAIIGSIINIKPILYVNEEGKLLSLSNARGRKKSLQTLVANVKERMGEYANEKQIFCIVHGDALEDALYLKKLLEENFLIDQIFVNTVSPSIGAHSGPGAIGICFMGEKR